MINHTTGGDEAAAIKRLMDANVFNAEKESSNNFFFQQDIFPNVFISHVI